MLIFIALVVVPIVEIALFIEVGGWLGLWPTIAIVILTAAIGTVLLRAQGLATLGELRRRMGAGEDPSATLAHGAMILVAGVLLLTPGFFTDGVGFLLLTPPVRAAAIRFARARIMRMHVNVHVGARVRRGPAGPGTMDGEYEVVDPEDGGPEGGGAEDVTEGGDRGWARVPGEKRGP
jgi:UPF0716 protein FxsA